MTLTRTCPRYGLRPVARDRNGIERSACPPCRSWGNALSKYWRQRGTPINWRPLRWKLVWREAT